MRKNLERWTSSTRSTYDSEFDRQIRELRPDWFLKPVDINKQQILDLAKDLKKEKQHVKINIHRYAQRN